MAMRLNLLRPGSLIQTRMMITPEKARHWKFAATNASIGGGIMANTQLRVADVNSAPASAKLELPARSPPAFITVTGEELATNFDMQGAPPPINPAPSPNFSQVFHKMSQRQLVAGAGLEAMRDARNQLQKDIASGKMWGGVAIVANALILPLNIIVNAFEVKTATSLYQAIVKEAYAKFSKSGTRIDSTTIKTTLNLLKKATVDTLTSRGLKQYIPGVNILVGVAEDGFALYQVASHVQEGSNEMRQLMRQMDVKIQTALREYLKIGIEMDRLLTELSIRARTS